jgi:hypothetical protein
MQTTSDKEYAAHVEQLLGILGQHHAQGEEPDLSLCVSGLEMGRDNKKIRDYAVKAMKFKGSDFDRAIKVEHIKTQLGEYPTTATRIVELMAKQINATVRYNGTIRKEEVPYIIDVDGRKSYISPDLWDAYEFKTFIATSFRCNIGFEEFRRRVRIQSAEYGLPFTVASLNDAADHWYEKEMNDRLWMIAGKIGYSDNLDTRERGQASLYRLAETCFDCPHGAGFVVAVFNKFIWQVKRKIEKMTIHNHLMPVILGIQGIGKSTLAKKLFDPVEELHAMTDFQQLTDLRNGMLFRNFVIFLDEMGWANKAEMDTVKNILTAESLTRRIMQTTKYNVVDQNATFIGTANAGELSELIRDTSGTRRFIALDMKEKPDREVINGIDWQEVWRSVDERTDDPMAAFKEVLDAVQAADRTLTPIEDWLESLTSASSVGTRFDNDGMKITSRRFSSEELFLTYQEWEQVHYKGYKAKTGNAFGREMKLRSMKPDSKFSRSMIDGKAAFGWRTKSATWSL